MDLAEARLTSSVFRSHDTALLHLAGDLDIASAAELPPFVEPLTRERLRSVTIDLTDVHFIDLTGLRALSHAAYAIEHSAASCHVVGLSGITHRIIRLAHLGSLEWACKPPLA